MKAKEKMAEEYVRQLRENYTDHWTHTHMERAYADGLRDGRQKWISMKDQRPPLHQNVLCYGPEGWGVAYLAVDVECDSIGWFDARKDYCGGVDSWTYWCPLPDKPEEEKDEE